MFKILYKMHVSICIEKRVFYLWWSLDRNNVSGFYFFL